MFATHKQKPSLSGLNGMRTNRGSGVVEYVTVDQNDWVDLSGPCCLC